MKYEIIIIFTLIINGVIISLSKYSTNGDIMTRQEQKEKRRIEILYKGLELFVEKGYDATKTIDIANALNISEGLLFHYFKTKEDLYYELVRLGINGTNKEIINNNLKPVDQLLKYVTDIFNAVKLDINFARMFVLMPEATKIGTPKRVRELALSVNIIDLYIPIIIKGQEEGTIKQGDPFILSNALFRSIYGVCEGYALDSNNTLPDPSLMIDIIRRYE